MNKTVVYTPAEDFFYNTEIGSTFMLLFFMVLLSIAIGAVMTTVPKKASETTRVVIGVISGLIVLATIATFAFF